MTDGGVPRRPHDPDATVVMPAARTNQADETHVLPVVPNPVPAPYDITAEQGIPTDPGDQPAGADDDAGAAVARHGSVMAVASIVSRVTGFLRTAAIGAAIGATVVADNYNLANVLPGMVYELLLGGVLASVVVPLIVRARARDADRGEAYAQRLLSLAAIFLAGATVVAVLCAPLFAMVLTNDRTTEADLNLVTTLSYLLLPMIFFYGMAALFAAVLNTRGHFAAPAMTPILNNIVVIAMAGVFILLPAVRNEDGQLSAATMSGWQVTVLGLGTTLGIVVQAVGLWPALRRVGFRWKWRWDFRELRLRELGRIAGWMLVYVLMSQVAVFVILKLAKMAGDASAADGQNVAGPAIFNNAYLIFMMAHGVVAVSIITVLMPRMSAAASENRHADLAYQISLGTRLLSVVLVPMTLLYVILGRPLAVTLFEWGAYAHQQALDTGWVIAVAGLGLVPFAISQIQLFSFYAMPDTKTPALLNVPVVALRIGVDVLLFVVLPFAWVAAGLMFGNTISYVLAAALGYVLLRRRIGQLGLRHVFATIGRLSAAALIAAVPTTVLVVVMEKVWGNEKLASFAQLLVGALVMLVGFVAAAFALRIREVQELGTMLRARIGR